MPARSSGEYEIRVFFAALFDDLDETHKRDLPPAQAKHSASKRLSARAMPLLARCRISQDDDPACHKDIDE